MSLGTPRRVVYTAVMGRYEQLNEQPVAADSSIDFICFTDDAELESSSWAVRLIEPRFPLDPIRSARFVKLRGPTLLADYDESLWIDNAVVLKVTPESILDKWLETADFAIPRHSLRTSVLGEFDAVVSAGYDDPARVYEQLIHYSTLQSPAIDEVPFWTAILARRHLPRVDVVTQVWWEHLLRYSRRDQLSINFVVEAQGLPVNGVEMDNHDSEWHRWPVRVHRKWDRTEDRMANALRIPSAEIGRLQNSLHNALDQLGSLQRQNDESRTAILGVNEELNRVRAEATGYSRSLSWKITAPLRALSRRLRDGQP